LERTRGPVAQVRPAGEKARLVVARFAAVVLFVRVLTLVVEKTSLEQLEHPCSSDTPTPPGDRTVPHPLSIG